MVGGLQGNKRFGSPVNAGAANTLVGPVQPGFGPSTSHQRNSAGEQRNGRMDIIRDTVIA